MNSSPKFYFTRICFNSRGWRQPAGKARELEAPGSYNHTHGFGHEEWLFRSEWQIDGWRYAYLQGVDKSRLRLLKENSPFDLTLFTIEPDKRRRFVATIRAVECLSDRQADDALTIFKQQGWHETMLKEITEAGGDATALENTKGSQHVLNIRFRRENVIPFNRDDYAQPGDPVLDYRRYSRYKLYKFQPTDRTVENNSLRGRRGGETAPLARPFVRRAIAEVQCTREHARMQDKLLAELRTEFPEARIRCEEDFVDISVRTDAELILFEIKSDLEPREVIRRALGQILEYAFHPGHGHELPVRLFIVGRRALTPNDKQYQKLLQTKFSLPLEYRVVTI